MPEGLVNIDPFFKSKFKFPWDFMGLTLPCAGGTHSYIASAVAPYYPEQIRVLLTGKPAMFELRRFAKLEGGNIFNEIVQFCDGCESDRDSVAVKVLNFLARHKGFRDAFQLRIDAAYRAGTVSIPKECEPGSGKWQRHTNESW